LTTPTFRLADPIADRDAPLEINIEYVGWVFARIEKMSGMTARGILGAEVADYAPTVIDKSAAIRRRAGRSISSSATAASWRWAACGAARTASPSSSASTCAPYPAEMPEAFRAYIRYMALAL